MQKNTLISLYPLPIRESKPGLIPGYYELEAGSLSEPQMLEVGPAVYHHYVGRGAGDNGGDFVVKEIMPGELAEAIVHDFTSSSVEYNDTCSPALFWVEGLFDVSKEEHREAAKSAYKKQEKWFEKLINLADTDWSRLQDPRQISDIQRLAAKHFDLDRNWAVEPSKDFINCEMCATPVKAHAVICPQCGYILDKKRYDPANFVGSAIVGPSIHGSR